MKWGEQARVLRLIPGLEQAEFVRFGMIHRNTYINGPRVLRPTWQTRLRDDLFFAGQISGVEGYVESAASGLIAGRNAAAVARGLAPSEPPRETAIGALGFYVSNANPQHYQPTNITFGIMPALTSRTGARVPKNKGDRKLAYAERALAALDGWVAGRSLSPARPDSVPASTR
jgi:methylenetetrahydrofolate--tRNA-(uracil-5-)-methyltransferase